MNRKINKDLTAEQKLILFKDISEMPDTKNFNREKKERIYVAV